MKPEQAYHKIVPQNLGETVDTIWDSINRDGFRSSKPAAKHWLGEGIYFFIRSNSLYWAKRWNFKKPRDGEDNGIVLASVDVSDGLDLTQPDVMAAMKNLARIYQERCHKSGPPYTDGEALAGIVSGSMFADIFPVPPTCLMADFDLRLKEARMNGSRVFLEHNIDLDDSGTQVQLCVIKRDIISSLSLYA